MQVGEALQRGQLVVELGVVLHGARSQRVHPGIDPVVELGEPGVVTHHLCLCELGKRGRLGPGGHARQKSGRSSKRAGRALRNLSGSGHAGGGKVVTAAPRVALREGQRLKVEVRPCRVHDCSPERTERACSI